MSTEKSMQKVELMPTIVDKEPDIFVRCWNCGFPAFAPASAFKHDKQRWIIRKCFQCNRRHRQIQS